MHRLSALSELKGKKGAYVLLVFAPDSRIQIGKLGKFRFSGLYAYVGSARSGLYHRISRHFKKEKQKKWHIDYLLEHAEILSVFWTEELSELEIARKLADSYESVPGFGASDSPLGSHLFHIGNDFKHKEGSSYLVGGSVSTPRKTYRQKTA